MFFFLGLWWLWVCVGLCWLLAFVRSHGGRGIKKKRICMKTEQDKSRKEGRKKVIKESRNQGIKEGREEGRKEVKEEGRKEVKEEGRKEGRNQGRK